MIGAAINALVLPPIHLRDVRENLAALAREAGDVLHTVGADLRETEWDARTAARWSSASARLERCLEALRSARGWSRESLKLTSGPLRPAGGSEDAMRELHERLQHGLREHSAHGATTTAVLGTLLLQAEKLWTEAVPAADER